MLRKSATMLVAVLALATVGGCTGSDVPGQASVAGTESAPAGEPKYITRSDVKIIAEQAKGSQRKILADDIVSFDEYAQAVRETVECIRQAHPADATITVDGPFPRKRDDGRTDNRYLDYEIEVLGKPGATTRGTDSDAATEEADRVVADCRDEHLTDVDRIWTFQNLLTPEQRERERVQIVTCLRATGLEVDEHADAQAIFQLIDEKNDRTGVEDCYGAHPDLFVFGVE